MNRRRFLELLGLATAGATIAYSFPSVIVPRNIEAVRWVWEPFSPAMLAGGFQYHVDDTCGNWQGVQVYRSGNTLAYIGEKPTVYLTHPTDRFSYRQLGYVNDGTGWRRRFT